MIGRGNVGTHGQHVGQTHPSTPIHTHPHPGNGSALSRNCIQGKAGSSSGMQQALGKQGGALGAAWLHGLGIWIGNQLGFPIKSYNFGMVCCSLIHFSSIIQWVGSDSAAAWGFGATKNWFCWAFFECGITHFLWIFLFKKKYQIFRFLFHTCNQTS